MADHVSKEIRHYIMSRIKQKGTRPEVVVRKLVSSAGYRYRLNLGSLPGSPDLVFSKRRKVIFVHGCFWHQHTGCKYSNIPKSNVEYWTVKLQANVARDKLVYKQLVENNWDILTIWQCELKDLETLRTRIIEFLEKNL